LAASVITNSNA